MTIAPDARRLAVNTPQEAISALRDAGLRLSTVRRLVIEALFAADGPVSAPELAATLTIEESSVYRNLEVLERHGLTRHVHLGHGPGLYALIGRDDGEYLYCDQCGKITRLDPGELEPVHVHLKDRFGHTARFTHFAIVGVCAACTTRPRENQPDDHQHAARHTHSQ